MFTECCQIQFFSFGRKQLCEFSYQSHFASKHMTTCHDHNLITEKPSERNGFSRSLHQGWMTGGRLHDYKCLNHCHATPGGLPRRPPASGRCWCSCRSSHTAAPPPHSRWSTWSRGTWPGWCSAAAEGGPSSRRTLSAQDSQSSVRTICRWMVLPADVTDKPWLVPFTNKNPKSQSNLLQSVIRVNYQGNFKKENFRRPNSQCKKVSI